MPKSKNIGRNVIIEKAREYALKQNKNSMDHFNGFLSGVNFILDELDGKTIVHERLRSGDFVKSGTVTGCFAWGIKDIEYSKNNS